MRIWTLAAVAVALAGCAPASPAERQRLIDTNVAIFAPAVGALAVGAAYGYASGGTYSSQHNHSHYDHDRRPPPADAPRVVVQPPVLMEAPIRCRPRESGNIVCN